MIRTISGWRPTSSGQFNYHTAAAAAAIVRLSGASRPLDGRERQNPSNAEEPPI